MALERDIEEYGVKQTGKIGGVAIKLTSSNLRGLPDRMHFFFPGILVFVEYKSPGRKPRKNQIRWHRILKALGFLVLTIDSMAGVDGFHNWVKKKQGYRAVPPCKHCKECKFYEQ